MVMPTNGCATTSSPTSAEVEQQPGEVRLVPSGQWWHAPESELFVVDERHSAPSFPSPGHSERRSRPRTARTSSRRCSPSRRRTHHALPLHAGSRRRRPRFRTAARGRGRREQLVGQGLEIGCLGGSPLESERSPVPRKTALRLGTSRIASIWASGLDIFELHASDGLLPAAEVVGLAGEPPAPGSRRPARPSRAMRRMHHEVDAALASAASETCGTQEPVGARVEQALRVAAAAVGHPHESGHVHRPARPRSRCTRSRASAGCAPCR